MGRVVACPVFLLQRNKDENSYGRYGSLKNINKGRRI
jgi:hypothetical protein